VRIHLAGKHALKFELLDRAAQVRDVGFDFAGGALIALFGREIDEFPRVGESAREAVESADDLLEFGALPAEILRAFRLVPNTGLF
jgi:hypothetical protein